MKINQMQTQPYSHISGHTNKSKPLKTLTAFRDDDTIAVDFVFHSVI